MQRSRRHRRLTTADVLQAHAVALRHGDGRDGILNWHSIESAIARPYSGYYRSIARKAAALTESLARNHGFVDGNKRTTVILLDVLVTDSGYALEADDEEIEALVLAVADGTLAFDDIHDWLASRLRRAGNDG